MAARRKSPESRSPIGSCFAAPLADGRFAACQVIAAPKPDQREVITLDWLGDHPPTLDELADAEVLFVDHHSWTGSPQRCIVEPTPPAWFLALGVRPPLAEFDQPCASYGGWEGVAIQVSAQHWWDHHAPNAEVTAYKHAIAHAREPIEFELGGQVYERPLGLVSLRIGPTSEFAVELDAPLDWSVFDRFGRLGSIDYEGHDRGVLAYVTRRALIEELRLRNHGQSRIDLSSARLRRFALDVGDAPLDLLLGPEIGLVELVGYRGHLALRVEHPRRGRGLALTIAGPSESSPEPVVGLEQLTTLTVIMPSALDLATLGYPALERLTIHAKGCPITGLDALLELPHLHTLTLFDAYAIDPETMPLAAALPALTTLEIRGLRKTAAAILRQRLAGLPVLDLSGAKTDAWLAQNADNPFNDWIDEGAKLGRAACKAYAQTHAKLAKLELDDLDGLHRELLAFVRAFNTIDETIGLDTIHREHIYEVFHQLAEAREFGVASETLDVWFDELRDF